MKLFGNGALVAAVDGLGYGADSAAAARIAVAGLDATPEAPTMAWWRHCVSSVVGDDD